MKKYKGLFLIVGLLALAWLLRKFGLASIRESFELIGLGLLAPIALMLPNYFSRSVAWQLLLKKLGAGASLSLLIKIRIAGEAANAITPLNFAGGDPIRGWILARRGVPGSAAASSLVVDRTIQILATVVLIISGTVAAIATLRLPFEITIFLGLSIALLTGLVALFLVEQRRGLFRRVTRVLTFLRIKRFSEKSLAKVELFDQEVKKIYGMHRFAFLPCFGLHFFARLLTVIEIYIIAAMLAIPMTIAQALFISSVIPAVNFLGALIPGALGIMEAVMSGLFFAMSWDPATGLALQLVRRVRGLFWVIVGFIILGLLHYPLRRPANPAASDSQGFTEPPTC